MRRPPRARARELGRHRSHHHRAAIYRQRRSRQAPRSRAGRRSWADCRRPVAPPAPSAPPAPALPSGPRPRRRFSGPPRRDFRVGPPVARSPASIRQAIKIDEPVAYPRKSRKGLFIGVGAAAALLVVVGIFVATSGGEKPAPSAATTAAPEKPTEDKLAAVPPPPPRHDHGGAHSGRSSAPAGAGRAAARTRAAPGRPGDGTARGSHAAAAPPQPHYAAAPPPPRPAPAAAPPRPKKRRADHRPRRPVLRSIAGTIRNQISDAGCHESPPRCPRPAHRPRARRLRGAGLRAGRLRGRHHHDGPRSLQGGRRVLRQGRVRAGACGLLAGLRAEEAPRRAAQPRLEQPEERARARGEEVLRAVPQRGEGRHGQAAGRRERRPLAVQGEARAHRDPGDRRAPT